MHSAEEGGDRHAGEVTEDEFPCMPRYARRWEPREICECEARRLHEGIAERGSQPGPQHDPCPWHQAASSPDSGSRPGGKVITGTWKTQTAHAFAAPSMNDFSRSIDAIGDGSTPCRRPT